MSLTKTHPTLRRSLRTRTWLGTFALGCAAAFLGPVACENLPEFVESSRSFCTEDSDCSSGKFCGVNGVCEEQCLSCGVVCEETSDCPVGQFCSDGKSCQQECEPGSTYDQVCASGTCSDDGQCVGRENIVIAEGGAGGMGGSSGGENKECIDVEVRFEPQIPNVVLLIDRSLSMDARNFGPTVDEAISAGQYEAWNCGDDYNWRWNVVRNVLLHPSRGVVKPLEDKVRFGMSLYSSRGGFDEEGASCPLLTEVELGFGTHEQMLESFQCSDVIVDTPSRESLTAMAEQLAAADVEGPKVIVLATDGEPDNCTCPNWNAGSGPSCDPSDEANRVERGGVMLSPDHAEQYDIVIEAQRIHEELGIQIEVINLNQPTDANERAASLAAHLDDLAERGGSTSGVALDGFDPTALSEAFQSIIDGVRSCAIDLDGEIAPGKEGTGTVRLDQNPGEEIEFEELTLNDPDGWKVNSPTQIELVGKACKTIKSGDHEIDISFPCKSFIPTITR